MDCGGLIYDDSHHYIDHLAPFCALMGWPLYVCEKEVGELARRYYPGLKAHEVDLWDVFLPRTLVACTPRPLLLDAFGSRFEAVKKLFWLPHGHSDKGWKSPFFEALQGGEVALVYGQKMIDVLQQKKASSPFLRIGNFRRFYFLQHKAFYQAIATRELPMQRGNVFFYAPTWDDAEGNGSFWKVFPLLAEHLPPSCTLLVKVHPNTERQNLVELEILKGRYQRRNNIVFLESFPPIFPLLELADAYIGDMSSIGYDFLAMNRPMFFVNPEKRDVSLFQCGREISLEEVKAIFTLSEKGEFKRIRKETYTHTFDSIEEWGLIARKIEQESSA